MKLRGISWLSLRHKLRKEGRTKIIPAMRLHLYKRACDIVQAKICDSLQRVPPEPRAFEEIVFGKEWERGESITCRIHLDIEIDSASSHVKIAAPVGKALLFHDHLMASASKGQRRRCVSNECTVDFNVRARRCRLNNQRTG